MNRYLYSLVRCVPNPRTGEFVNYGAIVGDPSTGDWSVRQVSNERHVQRLADRATRDAAHDLLSDVGERIEAERLQAETAGPTSLTEEWLQALYHDHRSVVQLSPPTPIVADSAEAALDIVFKQMIIDPVVNRPRSQITKTRVLAELRDAYRNAAIQRHLLRERSDLFVGSYVHTLVDFAIGNGSVVQLTQGWSFQRSSLEEMATEVKAWGYALGRLRSGEEEARVMGAHHASRIERDVDVEVVIAPPTTPGQQQVFEEAGQVFDQVGARVSTLDDVEAVGTRAAELLDRQQ
ncbi:DUF3037 domain-containing protein [Actinomadura geliboluensis]|uniref:DUF3037 domain-containing protein n=1 Tax=Actinomadura geliboluensis TaxID=882440 RepID=A0A5S4H9P3_9ACTN|nr:DUF3037 domain-containing protein [Actinomadura geliboluensis]TMR35550.1 DUF3037 domain-containing protein [Actinomadura geliboluensis]